MEEEEDDDDDNTQNVKLLNLCPGLYILMQKAVILNTRRTFKKFLAEQ